MTLVLVTVPGAGSALVLELVQRLGDLDHWEPVGSVLETAKDALRDAGGITAREVVRMRRWATRWETLRPTLRRFYAKHAQEHECAHFALLSVLEGTSAPTGASRGELQELWVAAHGAAPAFDIVPTARRDR